MTCRLKNATGKFCVGGTLAGLQRTRNGVFTLADSVSLEELEYFAQVRYGVYLAVAIDLSQSMMLTVCRTTKHLCKPSRVHCFTSHTSCCLPTPRTDGRSAESFGFRKIMLRTRAIASLLLMGLQCACTRGQGPTRLSVESPASNSNQKATSSFYASARLCDFALSLTLLLLHLENRASFPLHTRLLEMRARTPVGL